MPNTREKLIELLYKAEEQADKRCDFAENCDKCPANNQKIDCMDWLKADCLLSLGVTVQKWIPVTERLPEDCEHLLVCYRDGWICDQYSPVDEGVTHWMPLPEPPKGE